MRIWKQLGVRSLALASAAALTVAGAAAGADDPPSGAVDHSIERYLLDGRPAEPSVADQPGTVCSAGVGAGGVVACFSSRQALGRAGASALMRGETPPGFAALPQGADRNRALEGLQSLASERGAATPPAARSATRTRTGKRGARARKADGYQCRSDPYTYVYLGANYTSTSGSTGYTGTNSWSNFSGTFDNKISSFWASDYWTSRWHDYTSGQGAYYGNGYACRYVENLSNANMTDGGTANDRFSSFGIW